MFDDFPPDNLDELIRDIFHPDDSSWDDPIMLVAPAKLMHCVCMPFYVGYSTLL